MLNLKRLQYLDAVYQYKNFTQASEALYVSQPAISSAVQALEEELGVRLVVRSSKGVTFTYEGEQFMIWARRILSTCEAAENAMRDLAGTAEQRLRLGISHVLTNPIVPMIFSTFLREHPKAQIYLNEENNKHAGAGTHTLPNSRCLYLAVRSYGGPQAVVGIPCDDYPLPEAFEQNLIRGILNQAGIVLEQRLSDLRRADTPSQGDSL